MRQHFNLQRYENNPRPPNISAKKTFPPHTPKKTPQTLVYIKKTPYLCTTYFIRTVNMIINYLP